MKEKVCPPCQRFRKTQGMTDGCTDYMNQQDKLTLFFVLCGFSLEKLRCVKHLRKESHQNKIKSNFIFF